MRLTPRQEIWRGLLHGQRAMLLRLGSELKRDFGLTIAQYEALLAVHQAPGGRLPATQLARELQYSSGSGSNLFARLEHLGLLRREAGVADGRTQVVSLTPEGAERIERATEAHVAALAREFEPLISDAEAPVLLAFARRLAGHEGVRSAPPETEAPGEAHSPD